MLTAEKSLLFIFWFIRIFQKDQHIKIRNSQSQIKSAQILADEKFLRNVGSCMRSRKAPSRTWYELLAIS